MSQRFISREMGGSQELWRALQNNFNELYGGIIPIGGVDGTVLIGNTGTSPSFSASPIVTSLKIGGSTASNVLLKNGSSSNFDIRLGDDSGYGNVTAQLYAATLALSVGTTPASAGGVRLTNGTNGYIQARNFENSADLFVIGVGVDNNLYLGGGSFASPGFRSGNGDNLDDVGAATTRWRTGYFSQIAATTYVQVGTNPASAGIIRIPVNSPITGRNHDNTTDIPLIQANNTVNQVDIAPSGVGVFAAGSFTAVGDVSGASVRGFSVAFASRPGSPIEGMLLGITDSTTAVWGATITGGGTNHVLAYYNGTNWTVAGK